MKKEIREFFNSKGLETGKLIEKSTGLNRHQKLPWSHLPPSLIPVIHSLGDVEGPRIVPRPDEGQLLPPVLEERGLARCLLSRCLSILFSAFLAVL